MRRCGGDVDALRQAGLQRLLKVGRAAQRALANECERLLDGVGAGSHRGRSERDSLSVEEEHVERVRRFERVQQAFERLKLTIQLLPLHGKRRVEERDHSLGSTRGLGSGGCGGQQRRRLEKTGLRAGGARGGIRGGWRGRRGIPVGDDCERVGAAAIESVVDRKVLVHFEIGGGEAAAYQVRGALGNMQRVELTGDLKVFQRMLRFQFERDLELARLLGLVRIRTQRDGEMRRQIFDRDALVVFDFEPLGPVRGNRYDAGAEFGSAARLVGASVSDLQEAGIDRLPLQIVIDVAGTAPLHDHTGNARDVIPNGEIGDDRAHRQRENISPLGNQRRVVGEDLPDADAGVAVIDANVDLHLRQRENLTVGPVLPARNQHAGIASRQRASRHQWHAQLQKGSHRFSRFCSKMRTRPLSVPIYM